MNARVNEAPRGKPRGICGEAKRNCAEANPASPVGLRRDRLAILTRHSSIGATAVHPCGKPQGIPWPSSGRLAKANNYRKDIVNAIIPYARKDKRYVLLVCDMGFSVVDNFIGEFPKRVFNLGVMEQGTVGIAAGMAMSGLIPVVYSIVNFLAFRAVEQIRNDVIMQGLNVKFIATGVNDYFKFLGFSHCCGEDDKKIMKIIHMKVFDPYEHARIDFDKMVSEWITDAKTGYIRV